MAESLLYLFKFHVPLNLVPWSVSGILHPCLVCKVIALRLIVQIPSMMSISPLFGQFGPKVQNAGQVPLPTGMWSRQRMNKPELNLAFDSRRTDFLPNVEFAGTTFV